MTKIHNFSNNRAHRETDRQTNERKWTKITSSAVAAVSKPSVKIS